LPDCDFHYSSVSNACFTGRLADGQLMMNLPKPPNLIPAAALCGLVPGRSSGYPAAPPTDPYLKISLIRFLGFGSHCCELSTRTVTSPASA
jgi:hypothetical protein